MKHSNSALTFALTFHAFLMTNTRALHLDEDGTQVLAQLLHSDTVASANTHAQV